MDFHCWSCFFFTFRHWFLGYPWSLYSKQRARRPGRRRSNHKTPRGRLAFNSHTSRRYFVDSRDADENWALCCSIIPPNSFYSMLTVEDCVITGGYFLSAYTSIYGLIHSFISGVSVGDADDILPGVYIRRLVHYFHTSYVVNNLVDTGNKSLLFCLIHVHNKIYRGWIPPPSHLQGYPRRRQKCDVKAFFALFAMAIFGNAFDKRTYMPLIFTVDGPSEDELKAQKQVDINAIPPLERQHYCYARGLVFNLIPWFFNHYRNIHCWARSQDDRI